MTNRSFNPETDRNAAVFLHNLNSLDFGPLAYKLMNPEDRPGMSLEQAADAITKYKGFLLLYHANPGKPISPSRYIDYVWHTHILDTELYLAQSAILFDHFLHHFPFFGKRGPDDEKSLLAAAEFTKAQALSYFGWDDDDWCGTKPRTGWPRPGSDLADLASVIFPAGADPGGMTTNADALTIQAGNFRHTIEHLGSGVNTLFSSYLSRPDRLAQILKLPIWVIVCMPREIDLASKIAVIQQKDRLGDIAKDLVGQRMAPTGFSGAAVDLAMRG
jgi:hypothetical protein